MSSNNNHINNSITRDNYEEYFLLYVDDELTADEKRAVEAFATLHPDLQAELDLLAGTKLTPDFIELEGKDDLYAASMKESDIDENLLLYIDNELEQTEIKKLEEKIKSDADYRLQYQLLAKTKLDSSEKIVYPYKEELYHKTERRISFYWLRIAAAAVIILWAGTTDWSTDEDATTTAPIAVQTKPVATNTPATTVTTNNSTPAVTETVTEEPATPTQHATAVATNNKSKTPATALPKKVITYTAATTTNEIAYLDRPTVAQQTTNVDLQAEEIKKPAQQIINTLPVTSEIAAAYNKVETTAINTVPGDAVATIENEKGGGSVKGFLRKATRFIERTTNINPVNENDELLIGAVSIKVK